MRERSTFRWIFQATRKIPSTYRGYRATQCTLFPFARVSFRATLEFIPADDSSLIRRTSMRYEARERCRCDRYEITQRRESHLITLTSPSNTTYACTFWERIKFREANAVNPIYSNSSVENNISYILNETHYDAMHVYFSGKIILSES